MPNRLVEQEKPQLPQPEFYAEAMSTPEMVKAKNTIEELLQKGILNISPELYPASGKPIRLGSDQLQLIPVVLARIPILVVAPKEIEIQLHDTSTHDRVIIHLPQDKGDADPCYVLDMSDYQIYPRETVISERESNYGSLGYCVTASGEYLGLPAVRDIHQDDYLSAIVLFAGCEAESAVYPHSQISALEIPANF
jgi:hypothetical protein